MKCDLYPYLLSPVYKDYIWGGRRIPELFDRDVSMDVCAESWEVTDRPEGMSIVGNGPCQGLRLNELVQSLGPDLLGNACPPTPVFPLLIKIIDAKQRLSVQVHPNDDNASLTGGEAKTEMWYVLDAEPGAQVFAGLKPGTERTAFEEAIRNSQLEPLLHSVPAVPGEAIYVPGGRVHAIAEGCLLLEIQQNSNTTYRVYDWGRMGKDGKPRELHVAQALQVIDWDDTPPDSVKAQPLDAPTPNPSYDIVRSPYFHVTRHDIKDPETVANNGASFHALFVVSGRLDIRAGALTETLGPGTSCLVPAALPEYDVRPAGAYASVIRITL